MILAVLLSLVPLSMGGVFGFGREHYKTELYDSTSLAEGDPVRNPSVDRLSAINATLDERQYFELVREHERLELAEVQADRATEGERDSDALRLQQARVLFLDERAKLDSVSFPRSGADFMAVNFMAYWLGNIPTFVWMLIPPSLSVCIVGECRGEGILAQAPFSRFGRAAFLSRFLLVTSALVIACAMLPGSLLSLARNGLGAPGHPIVFWRFGELSCMSRAHAIALYFAGYMLLGALYGLVLDLSITLRSTAPLIALYLCHFVPPLMEGPGRPSMPGLAALAPPSYLSVPHTVGHISYAGARDQLPIPGGSLLHGIACLSLAALAILLLSVMIQCLRCRRSFSLPSSGPLGRHAASAAQVSPG